MIKDKTRRDLYNRWHHIMERCYNPDRKDYKYYGGKGIGVCIGWHTFARFEEWFNHELENTALHLFVPRNEIVVDRIDPNGDYSVDNCRLITNSENSRRVVKVRDSRGRFINH